MSHIIFSNVYNNTKNNGNKMVKIALYFTTSKVFAYLILAIGSVYSFLFKDAAVLMSTFAAASAVIALKTYTTTQLDKAKINQSNDTNQETN